MGHTGASRKAAIVLHPTDADQNTKPELGDKIRNEIKKTVQGTVRATAGALTSFFVFSIANTKQLSY